MPSPDVGRERRVVLDVIERMLTHDVDNAGARLLGVVQVGRRICEAGPRCSRVDAGLSVMR